VPTKKEKQPLSVTHPELAKEADGWDPAEITAGSNRVLNWKCPKGHNFDVSPNTRTHQNSGCPFCANRRVLVGYNDLVTTHPEIASEAYGWDPTSVTFGSGKTFQWKCPRGHIFEMTPNTRTNLNHECSICSNRKVLSGFNDLMTTHPELAEEASGWNPSEFTAGMANKMEWVCKLGHKWKSTIYSRAGKERGCPFCTNQKVFPGFNDLKTNHPELAAEAFGWDPSMSISGSNSKKDWKCSKGHVYSASISNRSKEGGTGCPICSNRVALVGFNDLKTTHPLLSLEADGWDPKDFTAGFGGKKKWKCEFDHHWEVSIIRRSVGGTGCPTCSKYGFNPGKEAHLYFLSHPQWEMLQIGITNDLDGRLSKHKKIGWEVLETRGPMDGHLTQQWESAMLRMLKAKGADLSNGKIAGKFDGYSEAWSKSTFEVKSIKELMSLTEEFEAGL
jgi:hypothetical protein